MVGSDYVLTDQATRAFYSQDLAPERGQTAEFVVQPGSTDEVANLVRIAHDTNSPILARGGGTSYTLGYVPSRPHSILLDLSRMNKVIDIDAGSMSVTVQPAVTWGKLYAQLKDRGLRTPFYGTGSGAVSTVAGGLSHNTAGGFGAAKYGTAGDIVMGFEVVLGDGTILRTGAGSFGKRYAKFTRYYGPDLTGLFVGDDGAFGIKTEATLELMRFPDGVATLCLAFNTFGDVVQASRKMATLRVASEILCFSRYHNDIFANAGFDDLAWKEFTLLIVVEGDTEKVARMHVDSLLEIGREHGGIQVDDSIAKRINEDPFNRKAFDHQLLGQRGEVWTAVHGLMPFPLAETAMNRIRRVTTKYDADLIRLEARTANLFAVVKNSLVMETFIFWPDELGAVRQSILGARYADASKETPRKVRPARMGMHPRDMIRHLRRELAETYSSLGCSHVQIGKFYRFNTYASEPLISVVQKLKGTLDPNSIMNPGIWTSTIT